MEQNPNIETKEASLEHIEFETKYSVEGHLLVEFKKLLESLPAHKSFLYVEGPDEYWNYPKWWFENNPQWSPKGTFARYRKPSYGLDNGRKQLTWKYKAIGAKNNIQRIENNLDLTDRTTDSMVKNQLECSGMNFNFSIVKNCHIYKLEDATLVFYTVYDTTDGKAKKADNFVEIEIHEENIAKMTEEEAWDIIKKYEGLLAPLGINPQKRLRKSLYEMYFRETA